MISTGTEKPDPELRKVIRSHVMRKKNLGRLLPPRKTKERRPQDETDSYTDAVQTVVTSKNPIPRNFGFSASAVTFADSIEPEAVDVFLKCKFWSTSYLILNSGGLGGSSILNQFHTLQSRFYFP